MARNGSNRPGQTVKPVPAPSATAGWPDLQAELDRWARAGLTATFWWRDDDAGRPTMALERLLSLSLGAPNGPIPLTLAVIPAEAGSGLAARLRAVPQVGIVQHGWAHANHAREGRTIELGDQRPLLSVMGELVDGRLCLQRLFGARFVPAMVPPWNRIADSVAGALPDHGYCGLSSSGPRPVAVANGRRPGRQIHGSASGMRNFTVANVHIDIFRWQPHAAFIGTDRALGQAVRHLAARRTGACDRDEPTGFMTHHLQHDAGCWQFIERFLAVTAMHPAVRWLPARTVFGTGEAHR